MKILYLVILIVKRYSTIILTGLADDAQLRILASALRRRESAAANCTKKRSQQNERSCITMPRQLSMLLDSVEDKVLDGVYMMCECV